MKRVTSATNTRFLTSRLGAKTKGADRSAPFVFKPTAQLPVAFFEAVFVVLFFAVALLSAEVAEAAFPADFLVTIPQIVSKAFLPAVPGLGRSQTMWA